MRAAHHPASTGKAEEDMMEAFGISLVSKSRGAAIAPSSSRDIGPSNRSKH